MASPQVEIRLTPTGFEVAAGDEVCHIEGGVALQQYLQPMAERPVYFLLDDGTKIRLREETLKAPPVLTRTPPFSCELKMVGVNRHWECPLCGYLLAEPLLTCTRCSGVLEGSYWEGKWDLRSLLRSNPTRATFFMDYPWNPNRPRMTRGELNALCAKEE